MASVAPTSKELGLILSKLPSIEKKRIKKVQDEVGELGKKRLRESNQERRRSPLQPSSLTATLLSLSPKKTPPARPRPGPRAQAPHLRALARENVCLTTLRLGQGGSPLRCFTPAAGPERLVAARAGARSLPLCQEGAEQRQQQG